MSLEQLKAALARKQQKQNPQGSKADVTGSVSAPRSQVSAKKPTKKSAGRGR